MSNANTDISLTTEAWAEITIRQWLSKTDKLRVSNTYALANSFVHHVIGAGNGNVERIEFAFNFYGKFVDMGVGRGNQLGNTGMRKAKKWFSATFYAEVKKLTKILAEKYARKGQLVILEQFKS